MRLTSQIAALLHRPEASRGMAFDSTLVIWGGEFGRTPTVELPTPGANAGRINGRDHNHWGFSMWMAGGGVKGGQIHGSTDEFRLPGQRGRTVSTFTICTPPFSGCSASITEIGSRTTHAGRDFPVDRRARPGGAGIDWS